ncbi:MAG: hypothetical protein AAB975_00715, partial [Patescibacteria group bacterium]
ASSVFRFFAQNIAKWLWKKDYEQALRDKTYGMQFLPSPLPPLTPPKIGGEEEKIYIFLLLVFLCGILHL